MTTFHKQFGNPRLYAAPDGPGRFLLVLRSPSDRESIELRSAWTDSALTANLVYSAGDPGIDAAGAEDFVDAVLVRTAGTEGRGFVWLADPGAWRHGPLGHDAAPMLGVDVTGKAVVTGLSAPIVAGAHLTVANQSRLTWHDDEQVGIEGRVGFAGERAPYAVSPVERAVLRLAGPERGTIAFRGYFSGRSLRETSCWGFQFLYPDPATARGAVCQWLPLADSGGDDALGFDVRIDASDPLNAAGPAEGGPGVRSLLAFTGVNIDGAATSLKSGFRTERGRGITLYPVSAPQETHRAALVFNRDARTSAVDQSARLSPMGDFEMAAPRADARLLCGLHGTEQILAHVAADGRAGDRLRFHPYQAAYAAGYPFAAVSPVAAQPDERAPLLDTTYTTSWVSVVASSGAGAVRYVAQPTGSALYGQDVPIWNLGTELMGWRDPAGTLSAGAVFPLMPYSGYGQAATEGVSGLPPDRAEDFERQVIGPTRRRLIGAGRVDDPQPEQYTVVTPSGFLVSVIGDRWSRILLGQTADPPRALAFCNPEPGLQEAFQTGQLFLVVANDERLGEQGPGAGTCPREAPRFCNTVTIGGWRLAANVGTRNQYDDYRNVLIVKGRKGKLYDPRDPAGALVANPAAWTGKDQFAVPSVPSGVSEPAELVILSAWLYRYFEEAHRKGGPQLRKFNAIAQDENWTGVLVLRVDIDGVPDDLVGLTAGLHDRAGFAAHHLGVEISPITNDPPAPAATAVPPDPPGPCLAGPSSMFGLIDYTDPEFATPQPDQAPAPVRPASSGQYEFRVLSLNVVFENTAVRSFSSLAQLTATSWFDMLIERMGSGGNPYNAILFEGALQTDNGRPVYSLSSTAPTTFHFGSDVVDKLEIDRATLSTRSAGALPGTEAACWFGLSGFLDFRRVEAADGQDGKPFSFDVFSFGSDPEVPGEQLRRGLAFDELGVSMTFPRTDPGAALLKLNTQELRFDTSASTPRPGSLAEQFALDVEGLVRGAAGERLADHGYVAAATDARLTGVDGDPWWGVDYRLTMGTLGDLAGKAGLVSHLVTAWAVPPIRALPPTAAEPSMTAVSSTAGTGSDGTPGDVGYPAAVGLRLPGANGSSSLLSLQGALPLSVGRPFLAYDRDKDTFLLLFSEIGLKLFGMLSIPPGSTLFTLFGDPGGAAAGSGLAWFALYGGKQKGSVL